MLIVAGVLNWNERPRTLAHAVASAAAVDLAFTFGNTKPIRSELEEAQVRSLGLERAQRMDAEWYLQLDADERLVHGELLRDYLPHFTGQAWPLPYVLEGGVVTVAPFKLIRAPGARIVLGCDVIDFGDGPRLCSGFSFPPELERALPALPHLLHVPSERPDADERPRLSERIEGTDTSGLRQSIPPLEIPRERGCWLALVTHGAVTL